MIWYALFLAARLAVAAFALLTWAYSVTTYSPFAFEMFVRPQLFPWLAEFVAWHHVWYWGAYVLSVSTLVPDLVGRDARQPSGKTTRRMALAYSVCFGAIGVYLVGTPYLSELSNKSQSLAVALVPLTPLIWLAAIDHYATCRALASTEDWRRPTGQRPLLFASLGAAVALWLVHFARALSRDRAITGALAWTVTGAWALVLDLTAFMVLYAILSVVTAVAASRRNPRVWEYGMTVVLFAAGICEFFRRMVFPSLSFDSDIAFTISVGAGVALAAMWSGLRLRRAVAARVPAQVGIEMLVAPQFSSVAVGAALLVVVPLATFAALDWAERVDWDFLVQKALVLIEGTLLFGVFLALARDLDERSWSLRRLLAPPLVALTLLHGMPLAAGALMATTADVQLDSEVLLDRYTAADPAFRFTAGRLIEKPGADADYYRNLFRSAERSLNSLSTTSAEFVAPLTPSRTPRPHVFMFVVDGLRRDYLSPYNPAVRFTPNFDTWARDSFVFSHAFTRYGGTWLAMPSIWAGGEVARSWGRGSFARINAIEKLIVANDYQVVINDYTVAGSLSADTKRTFLDPKVKSIDTDMCHLVEGLEQYITASAADPRPVFAFLSPMNVYLLNSSRSSTVIPGSDLDHSFYAPYANNVQRVDRCFGTFVSYLKNAGLYDNSVILLTSDHGESLGEDGNWGHQFWLFPEDVRIPLIVHIPARLRSQVSADLDRVSFSVDIAPTLYKLLGYDVQDLGRLFGAPLFVTPEEEPVPRRRQSFLVMSSYGPSYGLLRRNGRFLYISDLIHFREYAFELFQEPLGTRVKVSDDLRRVNQALIRERVAAFDAFHHRLP
jgi:membrane-anchored protein YejM (alkaline phosphatase superfamily)